MKSTSGLISATPVSICPVCANDFIAARLDRHILLTCVTEPSSDTEELTEYTFVDFDSACAFAASLIGSNILCLSLMREEQTENDNHSEHESE